MPAPRGGGVPLDRLREAVEGGVRSRSLRSVAREVGMSPSGLQKFLDGSRPYSGTRRKLERWYVREAARYEGGPGVGTAAAALQVLTQDLPTEVGRKTSVEILDLLDTVYRRRRRPSPSWIATLREELSESE